MAKIIRLDYSKNLLFLKRNLFRENGASGLFKGVDSKLLQSALAAGFMFLTYKKISAYVLARLGSKQLQIFH